MSQEGIIFAIKKCALSVPWGTFPRKMVSDWLTCRPNGEVVFCIIFFEGGFL